MDHLSILVEHHKRVRNLLAALKRSGPGRLKVLERLESQLELHLYLEEIHVYPVLEAYGGLRSEVHVLVRDHERLREELRDLRQVLDDEGAFLEQRASLSSLFDEHTREEETHTFPDARKLVAGEQLWKIDETLSAALHEKGAAA